MRVEFALAMMEEARIEVTVVGEMPGIAESGRRELEGVELELRASLEDLRWDDATWRCGLLSLLG